MTVVAAQQLKTGIVGLDDVLNGGLPSGHLYLIQGDPGVGKTTLGLQVLLAAVKRGDRALYISLAETVAEVREIARSHGWDLTGISMVDARHVGDIGQDEDNTIFHPSEVELRETIEVLFKEVARIKPNLLVLDSLTELRLLAQSELQFRRQVMRLRDRFSNEGTTVLLLDDRAGADRGTELQSLSHGVLSLELMPQSYGAERRRLRITKLRGLKFRGGFHDYRIDTGGIVVFPRLIAAEHRGRVEAQSATTGNEQFDIMLGGGLDRGTSTLVLGPAGSGKSSLTMQFVTAAARRGEQVAVFLFDEGLETLRTRATALDIGFDDLEASGLLLIQQVDPAELAPDELVQRIRTVVETKNCRMVVIDSLNGYLHAMPDEKFLTVQLHELLSYLAQYGITTILVMSQHGIVGPMSSPPVDVSYVADSVILTRFFEAHGRVRKAISVVKKRTGTHEDTIRELQLGPGGVRLGGPLKDFRGVLTGVPQYIGGSADLLEPKR